MPLSTQPYKGARDFYPEDKRLQKYLFGVIRTVVERFGYEEYDAPILEALDLYLAKSGEEIVNEQTYAFEDRGGRRVAIRPEMTPTVSRMVAARRQELPYPLRWYSIPNLWRYERPQKGRLREHWQLNVDIFGLPGLEAEYEIIQVADQILRSFGARSDMYTIKLNSRKFIDYVLLEYLALDRVEAHSIAKLIDRMHKMERVDFIAQADMIFTPSQRESGAVEMLLDFLDAKRFTQLPAALQEQPSLANLKHVINLLEHAGLANIEFDATLMRGFDYYTDIVFEIFDTNPENNRSMLGGGRYDGLVGLFGVDPVPTVGFGFGDVTLYEFLKGHKLLPDVRPETDAYVVLVGDVFAAAQRPIGALRDMGLNLAVDLTGRRIGDQIHTADKKGLRYVIIVGENELTEDRYTLKDLFSGAEEQHGLERMVSIVKDYRHQDDDEE
jgi:histidyl-tRNA synthetase